MRLRIAALAASMALWVGGPALAADSPKTLDQGADWTAETAAAFYREDQGSRIMPLSWMLALQLPDGRPFLDDSLQRYGYLPNTDSPTQLPVGFTTGDWHGSRYVGMNCSACHTRQIMANGAWYRIDGGPGIVDFQSLLADLDVAVGRVVSNEPTFTSFAGRALGSGAKQDDVAKLKQDVAAWYEPFHTLMATALPKQPWGPGRLDAVGMILNRLTGLDIGDTPDHVLPQNIRPASAPARYPFIWNAAIQDKTQWPGFADNGNDVLGLARNVGEVYGVFGVFHPKPWWFGAGIDYKHENSVEFDGLTKQESWIRKIGAPRWPFPIDTALAARGKAVFEKPVSAGGCAECHRIETGALRGIGYPTWKTPVQDVGTDSREYEVLGWTADTGVLKGAHIPFLADRLADNDTSFNVLKTSVLGAILEHYDELAIGGGAQFDVNKIAGAFNGNGQKPTKPKFAYESRVLQGIWAAAPYLHNGSVPTLADLLEPPPKRPKSFIIGPNYDLGKIGIATEQTKFTQVYQTTGCSERNSGNSNCGHDFGTSLSAADKKALLEYLKQL